MFIQRTVKWLVRVHSAISQKHSEIFQCTLSVLSGYVQCSIRVHSVYINVVLFQSTICFHLDTFSVHSFFSIRKDSVFIQDPFGMVCIIYLWAQTFIVTDHYHENDSNIFTSKRIDQFNTQCSVEDTLFKSQRFRKVTCK